MPSSHIFLKLPPLEAIDPAILGQIEHLDVSGRVQIRSDWIVSSGAYGDVLKGDYVAPSGNSFAVAIKRLRLCGSEEVSEVGKFDSRLSECIY